MMNQQNEAQHGMKPETILVIEEDASLADLFARMLSIASYQVESFYDSNEALVALKSQPGKYDLLMTEQRMSDLSTSDLMQQVSVLKPGLPILFCSGSISSTEAQKIQEIEIYAFLQKPFSETELARTVRCLLDKKKTGLPTF